MFGTVQKYYNLGGAKLVAMATISKIRAKLGLVNTDMAETSITLNGRDYVVSTGWQVYKWHQFEHDVIMPEVTRPMREILKLGDTVIDIGTARGDTTLYAHSLVGESGEVYAFEPDVTLYKALTDNVKRNELEAVNCFNVAASDAAGELPPEEIVGQTTAEFQDLIDDIDTIDVVTLDGFIAKHQIDVDLVKIDVDGADLAVLRGAVEEVLGKVPLILEVHSSELLDERRKTLEFVFEHANDIQYLSAQLMAPSEYKYGTPLSSPDDLNTDIEVNLLVT